MTTAYIQTKSFPKTVNISRKKYVEIKAIKDFLEYSSSNINILTRNLTKEERNSCILTKSNVKLISLHNAVVLLKRVIKISAKYKTKQLAGRLLVHWRTIIDIDSVNILKPEMSKRLNRSSPVSAENKKKEVSTKKQLTTEQYARLCDNLLEEINYPHEFRIWKKLSLLSQQFPDVLAFKEFSQMNGLTKPEDINIEAACRLFEIDQIKDYIQQKFNKTVSLVRIECVLIDIGFLKKTYLHKLHLTSKGKPYAGVLWNSKGEQIISWKEEIIAIVVEHLELIEKVDRSKINTALANQFR